MYQGSGELGALLISSHVCSAFQALVSSCSNLAAIHKKPVILTYWRSFFFFSSGRSFRAGLITAQGPFQFIPSLCTGVLSLLPTRRKNGEGGKGTFCLYHIDQNVIIS